jgi:hypothetical protein
MMDTQTIGTIVGVVVLVTVVLYVWDRRTKHQSIDYMDAAKLAIGAGGIAGGVTYAIGSDSLPDVMESMSNVQEMFVGKPEF